MTTAEFLKEVRTRIAFNEGCEDHVYLDKKGIKTAGIGVNLEASGAREECRAAGVDYDALLAGTIKLTDDQIQRLFNITLAPLEGEIVKLVKHYYKLSDARRFVLIDMAFNMGTGNPDGLGGFTTTLKLIDEGATATEASTKHGLFAEVSTHILESDYAKDVGDRAKRNAEMMATSDWVPLDKTYE